MNKFPDQNRIFSPLCFWKWALSYYLHGSVVWIILFLRSALLPISLLSLECIVIPKWMLKPHRSSFPQAAFLPPALFFYLSPPFPRPKLVLHLSLMISHLPPPGCFFRRFCIKSICSDLEMIRRETDWRTQWTSVQRTCLVISAAGSVVVNALQERLLF